MNCAATQQPANPLRQACAKIALLTSIVVVPLFASAGCHSDPRCRRETALMRAEILDIEDKYAALKSRYEANAIRLHSLTGEPIDQTIYSQESNYQDVVLEDEFLNEMIIDEGYSSSAPIVDESGLLLSAPQTIVQPGYNGGIVPAESIPQVAPQRSIDSLPLPGDNSGQTGDSTEFRLNVPGLNRFGNNGQARGASARLGQATATEIVVNRSATRGQDVDGVLGDEGLNLMIQPRSANGRVVLQAGDLSVSLVDPKLRKRIGFWRFLPEEVELFFVNDEIASEGILLHLPWDEATPQRARLLVHVEFVTTDGRVLKTSSDVLIRPPADDYSPGDPLVARWTQRDSRWSGNTDDSYDRGAYEDQWEQSIEQGDARFSRSNGVPSRIASEPRGNRKSRANPDQPKWRPVR